MKHKRTRRSRTSRRKRKHLEGMTLIELMIVMVIMALVATAAGFAVIPALTNARIRQASTDASTIRQMATAYLVDYDECPSVEDLLEKRIMSSSTTRTDPWGNAFAIECDGLEPKVTSAGPDEQVGTEDDIG
jgi:general secretion pathway protein G